jgi:BirA family transcriptional regulator, biotin operon repressor / biotin---[acetyl-CoA-carboxylase] ligase
VLSEPLPADLSDAIAHVRDGRRLGRLGSHVLFFSSVGSTNDIAMTLAATGEHEGAVVVADRQTEGRGRRGRRWVSPPAAGLYASVVLRPARARIAPDRATALLTLSAGAALAEAIESVCGLGPDIKWPNDLLIGGRKLAGILAEGMVGEQAGGYRPVTSVVLGYGINVGPAPPDPELGDRATSLERELGRPIDRAALFAETLAALAARYDDLLEGRFDAILDAWRRRAPSSVGARVQCDVAGESQSGRTEGVDDWGALLVRFGSRVERIVTADLTWV